MSIRAVANMGIVEYAINGVQDYARGAVAENEMIGNAGNTIDSTLARLQEIQSESSTGGNGITITAENVHDYLGKVVTNYKTPNSTEQITID